MNILRFLICNSRMSGRQILLARHMTTWDDLHQCYTHVCADKAEYDKLSRELVAKQNKRLWGDVEVFNTLTGKRSKVTDIIGVLLGSELKTAEKAFEAIQPVPQASSTPSVPGVSIQTPGDSQSGGAEAPAESKGTFSKAECGMPNAEGNPPPVIDIAADLVTNGADPAADVGPGEEAKQVSEEPPVEAPPVPTSPAKAKAKPKKGK